MRQPLRQPSTRVGRVTRLGKPIGLPRVATQQALASRQRSPGALPSITIVVPTYKEAENLPHLIDAVARVRDTHGLKITLLIVDDDSRDGSVEIVASRPETWVQILVRTGDRGLSEAVLDGLRRARGDVLVCMDADLSHPPEAIPQMLGKLQAGADFVVGSRYVAGGATSDDWGFLRWLNSRVATLLARPLTTVRDPMAGFFALRRSTFESGRAFNPIGYKIGLELMVKCNCERVVEVPIHFEDRRFGKSKLTLKQQLLYLKHLRRLYIFKYGVWTQLTQFLLVGGLGTIVNLTLLTMLIATGLPPHAAVAGAILVAMCFNFVLNRRFSFAGARRGSWWRQLVGFVSASSMGAVVNYATTLFLLAHVADAAPQTAALVGITAGTSLNFLASRYLVFRSSHVRPASTSKSGFPGFFGGGRSGDVLFEVAEDGLSDEAMAGPGGVVSVVGDE
jgi:dolichol-phosphate mannosyltransferase